MSEEQWQPKKGLADLIRQIHGLLTPEVIGDLCLDIRDKRADQGGNLNH